MSYTQNQNKEVHWQQNKLTIIIIPRGNHATFSFTTQEIPEILYTFIMIPYNCEVTLVFSYKRLKNCVNPRRRSQSNFSEQTRRQINQNGLN